MKFRRIHGAFHAIILRPFINDLYSLYSKPIPVVRFPDGYIEYQVDNILADRKTNVIAGTYESVNAVHISKPY